MIVCFTSFYSLGCTFLDWSFYWLSGRDKFWRDGIGLSDLSFNPIMTKNAHGHEKNHPLTMKEWDEMIKNFKSCDKDFPLTFYGFCGVKEYLSNCVADTYLKSINFAVSEGVKVVYLYKSTSYPYFKDRLSSYDDDKILQELKSWCVIWFPKIKNIKQKVETVGGLRDFISYNMNFLRAKDIHTYLHSQLVKIDDQVLLLDCRDWWFNGLETMEKIFQFLKIPIKKDRVDHWLSVYNKWKKQFDEFDEFERLLPKIAEHIVKGKQLDLRDFHLDIFKEALILEKVMIMYGHRLNIKNLDIFPKDAIELHKLIKK